MNTGQWIAERVSRLRLPAKEKGPAPRSTNERLRARLRQEGEALAPRALRQLLDQLKGVVDPLVSEVEGGRRAQALIDWYGQAEPAQRRDLWLLMSEHFMADPQKVKKAQAEYQAAVGTPDEAAAEVRYRRATVSPRRRILQRFSANPQGIPFLVALRAELQSALRSDARLQALDVEMEYMFSTWFDVGFLELRRISWDSPASLIEKLIRYEAVHDVRGWNDMKNRLDSDRRCYGFFHPRLPGEPLIFVEVALMNEIAGSITPLLDESAAPADLSRATTAIFYSISNTQVGLRGVSFGDSLIKRVVDTLKEEFPRLRTFATLSPIPGLRAWLAKQAPAELLAAWDRWGELDEKAPERQALLSWAARYLGHELLDGKPLDPVARFHLGNGARVERIHWGGDPSAKGNKQSFGLMVNYLYDLRRLDKHRAMLAAGKIPIGGAVEALYR
ncbi:MAG: malonyl-CoA decarboxylase [Hydrogenophaga sp.]|uniref:malonyl-CoA decarboxylase n=1 Tax=Hydrogenophaga sp. TaxID=1904254 RepID=UPI001695B5A5|nr:malonyl-CoA decarboxylase [Hydrogenophaga sp.]NIM43665.1 malonyl-CoA decarboxylase [Hydrogenophaga sp.]NIN28734.1 malonyl-CoA decarboxylase [Hydrogenophaga sp.]NIN33193.1 malonyl-CoA decarboxylase [Hydrogenophaga sp.]NIN57868.1 malonyl-CoA decarboxylase [Hydrogenophaga sp.]NIO54163.1 malonyl-CoA decarboxylase [Hydrogenophaga sp.]